MDTAGVRMLDRKVAKKPVSVVARVLSESMTTTTPTACKLAGTVPAHRHQGLTLCGLRRGQGGIVSHELLSDRLEVAPGRLDEHVNAMGPLDCREGDEDDLCLGYLCQPL